MVATYKGFPKEWPPIKVNPFDDFDTAYRNVRDSFSSINDLRKILTKTFENIGSANVVKDFGAKADGTNDTTATQAAIDQVNTNGGGIVVLPEGTYSLASSTSTEEFFNDGVSQLATTGCLILRDNVHLVGMGEATILKPQDANDIVILCIASNNAGLHNLQIDGVVSTGAPGHGIFQLYETDVSDATISNLTFENLWIRNVGGYGIGIENGTYENIRLSNVRTKNTGADGIDIKNRGTAEDGKGIFLENIYVESFGQRLNNQAGVDLRGIVNANNIQVVDVGRSSVNQTGIRFRTLLAGNTESWARRSSLSNFYIRGDAALATVEGFFIGSADISVFAGTIEDCDTGVLVSGSATGGADRVLISGVSVDNSDTEAFRVKDNNDFVKWIGCTARDSLTGFNISGQNCSVIGCDAENCGTDLNISVGAIDTLILLGNHFDADWLSHRSPAAGRVRLEARGSSANIDIELTTKGTGNVRTPKALVALGGGAAPTFGTIGGSGPATAAQNTWAELKDSAGVTFWVPAWR